MCLFGPWNWLPRPASAEAAVWKNSGVFMPTEASRLRLVPRQLSDGFDFQLFLISASVRRKTVPAMKYLSAPMRLESASSGSTVRVFSLFFLSFCHRLEPNEFSVFFGCWESMRCFRFGWTRTQTFNARSCGAGRRLPALLQKQWNGRRAGCALHKTGFLRQGGAKHPNSDCGLYDLFMPYEALTKGADPAWSQIE